jgi:hypothetical protein
MPSILDRLRRLIEGEKPAGTAPLGGPPARPAIPPTRPSSGPTVPSGPAAPDAGPAAPTARAAAPPTPDRSAETTRVSSERAPLVGPTDETQLGRVASMDQAREYLERIQQKIASLAEEFASGAINRSQFQELFDHYQNERRTVETWIATMPGSTDWKKAAREGHSVVIRSQHTSRVLGYAIYENESGMPVQTIGRFEVDPALAVPMLSSYRSATKEIFGGEIRSTQIEGGRWLCFVPGEVTTMMAVFSTEPAAKQLKTLTELHQVFETANRNHLRESPIDPDVLVFPHGSYLGQIQ